MKFLFNILELPIHYLKNRDDNVKEHYEWWNKHKSVHHYPLDFGIRSCLRNQFVKVLVEIMNQRTCECKAAAKG